jgi:hypothetical protein
VTWAGCLHPHRRDDCRCDGCPLRGETAEGRDLAVLKAFASSSRDAARLEEIEAFRHGRA